VQEHAPLSSKADAMCRWLGALVALSTLGLAAPAAHGAEDVAALQVALRAEGLYAGSVDGVSGPATVAAVRRLQSRHGLTVDGVAGQQTRRALGWRGRPPLGTRPVMPGRRGWDVAAAQFLLAGNGFASGPFDGAAGPRFAAALRRYQRWAGLPVDGVAGPATISRLHGEAPRAPLLLQRPTSAPPDDGYGPRGDGFHTGVDYRAPTGAAVLAAGRGCVTSAGVNDGYGQTLVIAHRLGVSTWYAHLSRIDVRPGQCVAAGQRVAAGGATGRATGPHLHFEVRVGDATTDPRLVLR
jgi:peptidoglycan hydrolase-like protein with peptidoglycan-binding domain